MSETTEKEAWEYVWNTLRETITRARDQISYILTSNPKLRRVLRKRMARARKSARILARQVRRAGVIVNQVPPLLHRGKAAR